MLQLTAREVLDLVVNDAFHIEWLRHVRRKLHTPVYVSVRQRTSSIRPQHTSAYVSIRPHLRVDVGVADLGV